jgi:hypothetical protein
MAANVGRVDHIGEKEKGIFDVEESNLKSISWIWSFGVSNKLEEG